MEHTELDFDSMDMSLEKSLVPPPFEQEAHKMGGSLIMLANLINSLHLRIR